MEKPAVPRFLAKKPKPETAQSPVVSQPLVVVKPEKPKIVYSILEPSSPVTTRD
jgi:hypothetical protein